MIALALPIRFTNVPQPITKQLQVSPAGLELPALESACLQSTELVLRPPVAADIEPLFAAVLESAAEIRPWMAWYHPEYSLDDTARWVNDVPLAWQEDRAYSFAIVARSSAELLGTIGINQVDRFNRRANLGYFVRTTATKRGIATAATRLLAEYGFAKLGLQRIEIVAATGNFASQKVALKTGASREGVARRRSHVDGRQIDTVMFSLLPQDLSQPSNVQ
jgi:RimJ/RimL family protein N-acetyltransferase